MGIAAHTIDLTPEQALRLHLMDLLIPMLGDRKIDCVLAESNFLYNSVMSVESRVQFDLLDDDQSSDASGDTYPALLNQKHLSHLTSGQLRYLRMVQQILGLRNGRDIEAVRKDADKMYHAILQFSPKCKQAKLDALEQRLKADANVPHVPQ